MGHECCLKLQMSVNLGATARALAVPSSVTNAIAAMDLVLLASFFMASVEVLRRVPDVSAVSVDDKDDGIPTVLTGKFEVIQCSPTQVLRKD